LVTEAHGCEQLAQSCYLVADRPGVELATFRSRANALTNLTEPPSHQDNSTNAADRLPVQSVHVLRVEVEFFFRLSADVLDVLGGHGLERRRNVEPARHADLSGVVLRTRTVRVVLGMIRIRRHYTRTANHSSVGVVNYTVRHTDNRYLQFVHTDNLRSL